jgi:hypothetical protein
LAYSSSATHWPGAGGRLDLAQNHLAVLVLDLDGLGLGRSVRRLAVDEPELGGLEVGGGARHHPGADDGRHVEGDLLEVGKPARV